MWSSLTLKCSLDPALVQMTLSCHNDAFQMETTLTVPLSRNRPEDDDRLKILNGLLKGPICGKSIS